MSSKDRMVAQFLLVFLPSILLSKSKLGENQLVRNLVLWLRGVMVMLIVMVLVDEVLYLGYVVASVASVAKR